jgi:hypothetical protein
LLVSKRKTTVTPKALVDELERVVKELNRVVEERSILAR